MDIAIEIKNSLRDALCKKVNEQDPTVNFYFNKVAAVEFPYVFLTIQNLKVESAFDTSFRNIKALCLLESSPKADASNEELFASQTTLSAALTSFRLGGVMIRALNQQFCLGEDVLKMTFELDFQVKLEDETELMENLEFTIK